MIYSRIYKKNEKYIWEVYKSKNLLYSGMTETVGEADIQAGEHRKQATLPKKRTRKQ